MIATYTIAIPFRSNGTAEDKTPVRHETMRAIEVLYDGARGQYLPRDFATECLHDKEAMELWNASCFMHEVTVLTAGPDDEEFGEMYYECWATILDNVYLTTECGKQAKLYQGGSGDLFLVCDPLLTKEERQNLYEFYDECEDE